MAHAVESLRSKHNQLQERHGINWTPEDSAAVMLQNQVRRMAAVKRLSCKRRLKAKHDRLAELNTKSGGASGWSISDSMANLLQAAFRAKLAKRAVEKATKFVVRARMDFWHSDVITELLRKPPRERTKEDLDVLHSSFVNIAFVHNMESKLVQLQCCRYLRSRTIQCGATVFQQGDVGDLLYIVLDGCVEYEIDNGKAVLHSGIGDYFGEQSLSGENGGRRDATVTAKEDTLVATLERGDYLRLSNELTGEVLKVLQLSVRRRKPMMLRLVRSLFQDTPFFHTIHFSVLQRYCCGLMQLKTLSPGSRLFEQGEHGEEFFIIIEGRVDVFLTDDGASDPRFIRRLDVGDSFGELALWSDDPGERIRTATIQAASDCNTPILLATLSRDAYMDATKRLERKVFKILAIDCEDRTDKQIESLFEFFEGEDFFVSLQLDGMRRQCCSKMMLQRVGASEVVFEQGDVGETFHIIIRGGVRVIVNGQTVRSLGPGASFGEIALLGQTEDASKRTATVMANDDTLMASITKADFLRVQDQKELQDWINKFWVLLTTSITEVGITAEVEWEAYRQLYVRIRKTIAPDFSRKQSRAAAKEDWQADLNRHNKGGHTMNHEQFSNALFELVDVWCEGAPSMLMYVEFLRMVYLNVTLLGRKKGHLQPKRKMKKVEDVSCLSNQLDSMRTSLAERFDLEEERAERDRQLLAERQNIGMVSSEMYVESSGGKRWVNVKALVKSAIKAGMLTHEQDLHTSDSASTTSCSSFSSSSSSSSDSDDEDFSELTHPEPHNSGPAGAAGHKLTDWPTSTTGSPQSREISELDLGRESSGLTAGQRRRQLAAKMDDMQEKLSAGVLTSSEQLESAILELQKMSGSDLRWTGMEQEHMELLGQLETQFAMKYAAETGTCYVPPDQGKQQQKRSRRRRAGHSGSIYNRGRGNVTSSGLMQSIVGVHTWRDDSWAPQQVWAQSLLSRGPIDISLAPNKAPPPDPRRQTRHAPRRRGRPQQHHQGDPNSLFLDRRKLMKPRKSLLSERKQSLRTTPSNVSTQDQSVVVRYKALESKRWFELETKPEGPRRLSALPTVPAVVPALSLRNLPTRPSSSVGMASSQDLIRPMSSYTNACLQVSRGGSHPSEFC